MRTALRHLLQTSALRVSAAQFKPLNCLFCSVDTPVTAQSHTRPARAWLDKLLNYEREGIPRNAGTSAGSAWDVSRVKHALEGIGAPHRQIRNVVHVVGSKGKGTVVALLASVLRAAGCRVGCYTSPHLLHVEERISIGVTPAVGGLPPSAHVLHI
jgi:UDP-N-acetylmuramyl pentapeptide synthase